MRSFRILFALVVFWAAATGGLTYRAGVAAAATQPACSDGLDNDGDGAIDYPADTGCQSLSQGSEDDLYQVELKAWISFPHVIDPQRLLGGDVFGGGAAPYPALQLGSCSP